MKISTALDHIDSKQLALPEFQRGYVWNRGQVRSLMQSMYRNDPVGTLLIWTTEADPEYVRGAEEKTGPVKLLLDGQQRITSLYGIARGVAPPFFQGNPASFTNLYFNVDQELFEFYGPVKMRDDPTWVSVTRIFNDSPSDVVSSIHKNTIDPKSGFIHMERLTTIRSILDREIHVDDITGKDRTIDDVVEIFNRINSGGTKLSAGDLALARVCADWPQARETLMQIRSRWSDHGYDFSLDWLLRCVTAVGTGQPKFTGLQDLTADEFISVLNATEKHIDFLLNLVADRLGLDHDRVLGGRGAFAAMAWYVNNSGGGINDHAEQQKLLYWYLHCMMWGRYSSSVETKLQRDLEAFKSGGVDGAIEELRKWRGDLTVRTSDFDWSTIGARFYPVLYMLTRVRGSRDFCSGTELKKGLLGVESSLHVHHIFPKAQLYKKDYSRKSVNALANLCFLTASCNLKISDRKPTDYMPEVHPDDLESQWVTTDSELWSLDQFHHFLADRRKRLASATNEFLESLYSGHETYSEDVSPDASIAVKPPVEDEIVDSVSSLVDLVLERGLSQPSTNCEVPDPKTDEPIATVALLWPDGMQQSLSQPAAYEPFIDGESASTLSAAGYLVFATKEQVVWYIEDLLGLDIDGDQIVGNPE